MQLTVYNDSPTAIENPQVRISFSRPKGNCKGLTRLHDRRRNGEAMFGIQLRYAC